MIVWSCCGFLFFLMIRRPPRSTRTDTRFPYTTLFRSGQRTGIAEAEALLQRHPRGDLGRERHVVVVEVRVVAGIRRVEAEVVEARVVRVQPAHLRAEHRGLAQQRAAFELDALDVQLGGRSEERRVGKEGVITGRSRWSPYH